jgi:putative thioredoxin
MMTSDFIINVSESNFEYEVLAFSQQIPVVVDFWAEWCGPCKTLGPALENLAQQGQGSFRLAKVDVDENPNLAVRYGILSIPAVKAFRDGAIVAEFIGIQPEPRLREFLHSIAPTKGDLALEKGKSLLLSQEAALAETAFRESLASSPTNTAAVLGLVKSLILQGKTGESFELISSFPASRDFKAAQSLFPLVEALQDLNDGLLPEEDDPLDSSFKRAITLIKRGNYEAAMDGLIEILRENRHYRSGKARLVLIAVFELLGEENPITRQYRNELASVLF